MPFDEQSLAEMGTFKPLEKQSLLLEQGCVHYEAFTKPVATIIQ